MGEIQRIGRFLVLVVLAASLTVACGKKGKKPEVKTQAPPATESTENQGARQPDPDSNTTSDDVKTTPADSRDRNLVDLIEDQFETSAHRIPGDRPIIVNDRYNAPVSPELMSPGQVLPQQLFDMNEPSYTGAKDPQNMYYTGAGQDNLLALLAANMNSHESEEGNASDLRLARELHRVRVIKSVHSNRLKLEFLRWNQADGRVATEYSYEGQLNENRVARMQPVGDCPNDLTVKVTCMDQGNGCRIRVVKIDEVGSGKSGRAYVVDRHTRGHIYLDRPTTQLPYNKAYWAWYNVTRNTELFLSGHGPRSLPQFSQLTMKTSAIVNGEGTLRAYLRIERKNQTEELVTINAPMVRSQNSSKVQKNLRLTPVQTFDKNGTPIRARRTYMGTLRRVTLVDNDGRGNFRFDLLAETRRDSHAESFFFSLLREHVQPDYSRLRTAQQN